MSSIEEQLKRIRQAKKLQYTQLRQEEKPKLPTCPDCLHYCHLFVICPATGKRHDLDQKKIIGGSLVEKDCRTFAGTRLRNAVTLDRVRWQPQRTKIVHVDTTSIHIFQSFVASLNWNVHRFGILYGFYDPSTQGVEVHAIYEPPIQHGNAFSFEEVDRRDSPEGEIAWKEEQRVNRLAQALGMRRVGVVCTQPAERSTSGGGGAILSGRELLRAAREQSIYGDECVLLTVVAPSTSRLSSSTTVGAGGRTTAPSSSPFGKGNRLGGPGEEDVSGPSSSSSPFLPLPTNTVSGGHDATVGGGPGEAAATPSPASFSTPTGETELAHTDGGGSGGGGGGGGSHCEAWQASEQCVHLYQMNLLSDFPWKERNPSKEGGGGRRLISEEEDEHYNSGVPLSTPAPTTAAPSRMDLAPSGSTRGTTEERGQQQPLSCSSSPSSTSFSSVWSRIPLELSEEKRNTATGKLEFQTFEAKNEVDIHWFTSCVAVERFESPFFTNAFMRRRVGFGMPTGKNLKQYWTEPKRAHHTFVEKVSDFQVLLFLLDALGEEAMLGSSSSSWIEQQQQGQDKKKKEEEKNGGWAGLLRKFKGIPTSHDRTSKWWDGKLGDRIDSSSSSFNNNNNNSEDPLSQLTASLTSNDFEELKKFSAAVKELMK